MRRPSSILVQLIGRRALLGVLAVAVVLGGCASNQAAEVAGVSITAPTSTTLSGPVAIEGLTGLAWDQGVTYEAGSFLVPVSFMSNRDGWLSRGAGPRWVALWLDEDLDGAADATLTLMAHRPTMEPDFLVSEILQIEGVRQLTQAVERTVGDLKMIVVDVEGEPDPQGGSVSECSRPASARFTTSAGYEFFEEDGSFGIPACYRSRVWIVEVGGSALTFVGVVEDEGEFDDLMVWLEQLLGSGVTFAPAG